MHNKTVIMKLPSLLVKSPSLFSTRLIYNLIKQTHWMSVVVANYFFSNNTRHWSIIFGGKNDIPILCKCLCFFKYILFLLTQYSIFLIKTLLTTIEINNVLFLVILRFLAILLYYVRILSRNRCVYYSRFISIEYCLAT